MNFTPEQRAEAERQLQNNPGSHRVNVALTSAQQQDYDRLVAAELARQEEVIRDSEPLVRALREETFSGELRRTISRCGRPRDELARAIGIAPQRLRDFLWGQAILQTDVVDRLMTELGISAHFETQHPRP